MCPLGLLNVSGTRMTLRNNVRLDREKTKKPQLYTKHQENRELLGVGEVALPMEETPIGQNQCGKHTQVSLTALNSLYIYIHMQYQ